MKTKLIACIWLLLHWSAFANQEQDRLLKDQLPFIRQGILRSTDQGIASPAKFWSVVYVYNGVVVPLTGSCAGLQQMMRYEFPRGIDEEFVRTGLIRVLFTLFCGDPTEQILRADIVQLLKEHDSDEYPWSRIVYAPQFSVGSNSWKMAYFVTNKDHALILREFSGRCSLFSIEHMQEIHVYDGSEKYDEKVCHGKISRLK